MNILELEKMKQDQTALKRDESEKHTPGAAPHEPQGQTFTATPTPTPSPSATPKPMSSFDRKETPRPTEHTQDRIASQPIQAVPTRTPESSETGGSSADQVRKKLVAALDDGRALTLVETAKMFGIRPRTLQERLQNEGVTFQALVQEARAELACELLAGPRSIPAVAEALAYADPRAFRRAFKRWTGVTPGVYRKRVRQERLERDRMVDPNA